MNQKDEVHIGEMLDGRGRFKLWDCGRNDTISKFPHISAFAIWFYFWTHENEDQECWQSNQSIAHGTGMSLATVKRWKRWLIENHWLVATGGTAADKYARPSKGAHQVRVYRADDPTKNSDTTASLPHRAASRPLDHPSTAASPQPQSKSSCSSGAVEGVGVAQHEPTSQQELGLKMSHKVYGSDCVLDSGYKSAYPSRSRSNSQSSSDSGSRRFAAAGGQDGTLTSLRSVPPSAGEPKTNTNTNSPEPTPVRKHRCAPDGTPYPDEFDTCWSNPQRCEWLESHRKPASAAPKKVPTGPSKSERLPVLEDKLEPATPVIEVAPAQSELQSDREPKPEESFCVRCNQAKLYCRCIVLAKSHPPAKADDEDLGVCASCRLTIWRTPAGNRPVKGCRCTEPLQGGYGRDTYWNPFANDFVYRVLKVKSEEQCMLCTPALCTCDSDDAEQCEEECMLCAPALCTCDSDDNEPEEDDCCDSCGECPCTC
jgi:hypothetical protein